MAFVFHFLGKPLSGFSIRETLAAQNDLGNVPSSSIMTLSFEDVLSHSKANLHEHNQQAS